MKYREAISRLGIRFMSANDIPVESARITQEEWLAIKDERQRIADFVRQLGMEGGTYGAINPERTARMIEGME